MKNLGYYNGKEGLIEEMCVPMTDRAIYFGDGVYDAVMCRNDIPYLLNEHIDRFFSNCQILDITVPKTKEELFCLICELVKKVDGEEKFVYFHVSRGSAVRRHTYDKMSGNLCITVTPLEIGNVYEKIDCMLVRDIRYEMCNVKTLNLLPGVLSAQFAKNNNCEETIFYRENFITEGSHSNVSIIRNGKVITAPTDCYILPGVARAHMINVAKRNGIEVEERRYGRDELFSADEIFITSSSKIIRGVKKLDFKDVGGKNEKMLSLLEKELYSEYLNKTEKV